MKKYLYISFIAFFFTLTGCSSSLYHLRPTSGEIAWIDGREVTRIEQNGIVLVASYEFEDPHHVALDVEIKNRTSSSILIAPNDFSYTAFAPNFSRQCRQLLPLIKLLTPSKKSSKPRSICDARNAN
ncbi:MAG: hypothetical protein R2822_29360 [Spirosomataceae bacterium]